LLHFRRGKFMYTMSHNYIV